MYSDSLDTQFPFLYIQATQSEFLSILLDIQIFAFHYVSRSRESSSAMKKRTEETNDFKFDWTS